MKDRQKERINLIEYGKEVTLSRDKLNGADIRYLKSLTISKNNKNLSASDEGCISFNEWTLALRALGWVGVIELTNYQISISPRFNRNFKYFVNMLQIAEGVSHLQENSLVESAKLPNLMHEFLELLAQMYLDELKRMLQNGIYKNYITEEENLTLLRGRPDFVKNLKHNFALPPKIFCSFDELTADIPENQYILMGLEYLAGLAKYLQKGTKQRLKQYHNEFLEVCTLVNNIPSSFKYNHLNNHYVEAHRLTRILIDSMTVVNLHKPTEQLFTVLFDMNEVFEKFTGKFLEKTLNGSHQVQLQVKTFGSIESDFGMSRRSITPDILVSTITQESDDLPQHLVIDTKNKDYSRNGKILNTDIYQITFYAQYFSHLSNIEQGFKGNRDFYAILAYPMRESDDSERIVNSNPIIRVPLMNGGFGRIQAKGINIDSIIEFMSSRKNEDLVKAALDLITES